jgi:hypothetical protein
VGPFFSTTTSVKWNMAPNRVVRGPSRSYCMWINNQNQQANSLNQDRNMNVTTCL